MQKYIIWFLILIAGIGFCLRISGIEYGLPSKNRALTTYHPDEPLSFYTIEKWKPAEFYFHPGRAILWGGFHLFPMAATLKIAQLIGYVKVGSRDFYINNLGEADKLYKAARFLQILCDTTSIVVLFFIAHQLFGSFAGLMASFIYAWAAVPIINSFNTRPDSMMVFFSLISTYFSIKIWQRASVKFSVLGGLFLGLATATKYSAAPYGVFLLFFHLFSPIKENKRNLFFGLLAFLISFLMATPYILFDFAWFYQQFLLNISMSKGSIVPIIPGAGFKLYLTYFLPYSIGWALTLSGFLGWLCMVWRVIQKRDSLDLVLAVSIFIIYFIITYPKSQQIHYTLPVIPLFALLSAFLFQQLLTHSLKLTKYVGIIFTCGALGMTAIYSLAVLNLYTQKNVREMASEWIEKNIPKGERIGIARSYFWTPGILRQYNPPYQILAGGGDQSYIDDAVLGLEQVAKKVNYLVLTEYEYRVYLTDRFGRSYPEHARILKKIMEQDYQELVRFEKHAEYLWFRFPKREDDPYDWSMPNPTIRIFKRIKNG